MKNLINVMGVATAALASTKALSDILLTEQQREEYLIKRRYYVEKMLLPLLTEALTHSYPELAAKLPELHEAVLAALGLSVAEE